MVVIGSRDTESSKDEAGTSSLELRDDLIREREITERLIELDKYESAAAEHGLSLKDYMSGGYTNSEGVLGERASRFNEQLKNAGMRSMNSRKLGINTIASSLVPEDEEMPQFTPEDKLQRTKFYLSLRGDARDDEYGLDARLQDRFLRGVLLGAANAGIDIAWKTQDHGYDYPDIYTTQPEKLQEIITTLYNSGVFPDSMWNDVPRVFQANIGGDVPTSRVGMVQEPSTTLKAALPDEDKLQGLAHSARMGALGKAFESYTSSGVERREAFIAACSDIGVKPESPWLLNDEASQAFLKAARTITS
jgi:hypothetical protein